MDTIWFVLLLTGALGAVVLIEKIRELRKAHKAKLKAESSKPVDFQGMKIEKQKVKCPVELCEHREGEYCTNDKVDLCMLVKNNYDEYGLYCKCFKGDSVVDMRA